jgi:hypothetical protein
MLSPGSTVDFHDRYAEKTSVLPKVAEAELHSDLSIA